MKIVIIVPTWPYRRGIAHYNNWLCNFLEKRNSDVHSFSYKKSGRNSKGQKLNKLLYFFN